MAGFAKNEASYQWMIAREQLYNNAAGNICFQVTTAVSEKIAKFSGGNGSRRFPSLFLLMNFSAFKASLNGPMPDKFPVHLKSLWYDGKGDWEQAHTIIQDVGDKNAAWIHAYLHRKEGDIGNADYWYNRAGRKRPTISLQEEWEELVNSFL